MTDSLPIQSQSADVPKVNILDVLHQVEEQLLTVGVELQPLAVRMDDHAVLDNIQRTQDRIRTIGISPNMAEKLKANLESSKASLEVLQRIFDLLVAMTTDTIPEMMSNLLRYQKELHETIQLIPEQSQKKTKAMPIKMPRPLK